MVTMQIEISHVKHVMNLQCFLSNCFVVGVAVSQF